MKLLTRDEFRINVFSRDHNLCVNCGKIGVDAHHILERRLFPDGGYYLDNGVTLCSACHLDAEKTILPVWVLRKKAKIDWEHPPLPPSLHWTECYDKWGNRVLFDKTRVFGPLKGDEAMLKILRAAKLLHLFSNE